MTTKNGSQPRRPPPRLAQPPPPQPPKLLEDNYKLLNLNKINDEENQLLKQISMILFKNFDLKIEDKKLSLMLKKLFVPKQPILMQKRMQLFLGDLFSETLLQEPNSKVHLIKNAIIQSRIYEMLSQKQITGQKLTNDQKIELQRQKYYLTMKKRKETILQDYYRVSNYKTSNTLLEKIVQCQIVYYFTKLYTNFYDEDKRGIEQLQKICSLYQQSYYQLASIQQEIKNQKRMSQAVRKNLQNIKQAQNQLIKSNSKPKELRNVYQQLINLWGLVKNNLNVFDIGLFQRLIKANEQSNKQISGKNIALLIGPSGAGKTTIMLRMLGYQLIQTIDLHSELKTLGTSKEIKPQHSGLVSRPGAKSITQTIFAARLAKKYLKQLQDLYLCDTPGFFDSSGPIVDIVNAISLINSVKNAKRIKPIVVISANMIGERLQGIKKLAKIVSNLFTKFDRRQEGLSTLFIFNKFSSTQQFLSLQPRLRNILENLPQIDKIDTKYVAFLQTLYQTLLKNNKKKYIQFKPFDFNQRQAIGLLQQNLIQNPKTAFQYFHSADSLQILQIFMKKKTQLIYFYLDSYPQFSCFHLEQLRELIVRINIGDYLSEYEVIKRNIEQKSEDYFARFKYLLCQETWRDNISDHLIIQSRQLCDKILNLDIFRKNGQCRLYSKEDIQPIINSVADIFERVKVKLEQNEALNLDELNIIKKISLFSSLYHRSNIQKQFQQFVISRFSSMQKDMERYIRSNQFQQYQKIRERYKKIEQVKQLFLKVQESAVDHFNNKIKLKYDQLNSEFQSKLSQIKRKFQALQLSYQLFGKQLNINIVIMEKIEKISEQQFSQPKIQREKAIAQLKNSISKMDNDLRVQLKAKGKNSIERITKIMSNFSVIQNFQEVRTFVQSIIANIKQIIQKHIDDNKKRLKQIMEKFEKNQISSSFAHMRTIVYTLCYFPKLVNQNRATQVKKFLEQIEDDFIQSFKRIVEKTKFIHTSLKMIEKNNNIRELCQRISQLKYVINVNLNEGTCDFLEELPQLIDIFIQTCKIKIKIPQLEVKQSISSCFQGSIILDSTTKKICEGIRKYNNFKKEIDEQLKYFKDQVLKIDSIEKQYLHYFETLHIYYESQQSKIQNSYFWLLSKEQQAAFRKRIGNLYYLIDKQNENNAVSQKSLSLFENNYQQHSQFIINSIKKYSQSEEFRSFNEKLSIGQRIKNYQQYISSELKSELSSHIDKYQKTEFQKLTVQLSKLFSQQYLDFQKFQLFYQQNKDNYKILLSIQARIQSYDEKLLKQFKNYQISHEEIENINNYEKQICLIEHGLIFLAKAQYLNNCFPQQICFQTDKGVISQLLDRFCSLFQSIFEKIFGEILQIDFDEDQMKTKISLLEKLQAIIKSSLPNKYAEYQQCFFINQQIQCFKNYPEQQLFPLSRYLTTISMFMIEGRAKDINQMIDPFNSECTKFYKFLNEQHKRQFINPLTQKFERLKSLILNQKNKENSQWQNQMKRIITLLPTTEYKQKYQDQRQKMIRQINRYKQQEKKSVKREIENNKLKQAVQRINKNPFCCTQPICDQFKISFQKQMKVIDQNIDDQYASKKFRQLQAVSEIQFPFEFQQMKSILIDQIKSFKSEKIQQAFLLMQQIKIFELNSLQEEQKLQQNYKRLIKLGRFIFEQQGQPNSCYNDYCERMIKKIDQLMESYQHVELNPQFLQMGKQCLTKTIRSKYLIKKLVCQLKLYIKKQDTQCNKIKNSSQQDSTYNKIKQFILVIQQSTYSQYKKIINNIDKFKSYQQIADDSSVQAILGNFNFLIQIKKVQKQLSGQKWFGQKLTQKSCQQYLIKDMKDTKANMENDLFVNRQRNIATVLLFSYILKYWYHQLKVQNEQITQIYQETKIILERAVNNLERQALNILDPELQGSNRGYKFQNEPSRSKQFFPSEFLNILIYLEKLNEIQMVRKCVQGTIQKILEKLPNLSIQKKMSLNWQLQKRKYQASVSLLCTKYRQFKHIEQTKFSQETKVQLQQYLNNFFSQNKQNSEIQSLSSNVKMVFHQFQRQTKDFLMMNDERKKQLIKDIKYSIHKAVSLAIGKIFALYSIIKRKNSMSTEVFKPHVSQVIAILSLLRFKQGSCHLTNNIVEILTGQGKSIVLGISACYLACFGFEVYQSCYSPMLVQRDKQQFLPLFRQLQIQKYIHYGSFEQTCESILPIEFKQSVKNMFKQSTFQAFLQWIWSFIDSIKHILMNGTKNKKILLLDQVDILFSKDFYNKLYFPTLDLSNEDFKQKNAISDLIDQIYAEATLKRKLKVDAAIKLKPSQKIIDEFPKLQNILLQIINQIFHTAQRKDYINKIAGKSSTKSKIDNNQCNKYQQFLAGAKLLKENIINADKFRKMVNIKIKLCQFSYYELPKYFASIIGLSGTIKDLGQEKQHILKSQYKINHFYHLPTIYKKKKTAEFYRLQKDYDKYNQNLGLQIKTHLSSGHKRAVLVLFEDSQNLNKFKETVTNQRLIKEGKYSYNELVYDKQQFDYDKTSKKIINTTIPNTYTLATRQFARGIDFKDKNELQQGLFVIMTYLPQSKQQYLQAKGRTARAGKHGKFLLYFHCPFLTEISVDIYGIFKLIQQKQQQTIFRMKNNMNDVKNRHRQSLQIYQKKAGTLLSYLEKINKFNPQIIRIIIGIQSTLKSKKQIIGQVISLIKRYQNHYKQKKLFTLQFRVFAYGNYFNIIRQKTSLINNQITYKTEGIDSREVEQFVNSIKKNERNETINKGESVQNFFRYLKNMVKENQIDFAYLFCSSQNLSWKKFIQTKEYSIISKSISDQDYRIRKSCQEYLNRVGQKTRLSIFCFSSDEKVKEYYKKLQKNAACISQLQFLSINQIENLFGNSCARNFNRILGNTLEILKR